MVGVKRFSENTYFSKMLISGKGKYFHVFGCISKNFPKNIFWCLEKKKENTNQKTQATTQEKKNHQFQKCFQSDDRAVIAIQDRDHGAHGSIAIDGVIAILDWSWSSRSRTGAGARDPGLDLLLSRAHTRSLSLSLSFSGTALKGK